MTFFKNIFCNTVKTRVYLPKEKFLQTEEYFIFLLEGAKLIFPRIIYFILKQLKGEENIFNKYCIIAFPSTNTKQESTEIWVYQIDQSSFK